MGVSGCSCRSMTRPPRVRNRPDLANADANNRSGQARIGLDSLTGYVMPRAGKTDARGRCRTTLILLRNRSHLTADDGSNRVDQRRWVPIPRSTAITRSRRCRARAGPGRWRTGAHSWRP
jgi:hypothetical protein